MKESQPFAEEVRQVAQRLVELDSWPLGALFDLTSQRLVRYACSLTRHQQDAEDVVQAVLVKVATHPHRLAGADMPWAYLLRMVRNEALLHRRRNRYLGLFGSLADLLTWCRVDELEQEEAYRAVWRALRRLPTEQAEVVVLKIWEGLTFAQIGTVLDVSPHTAASRYQYGIRKLENLLSRVHQEFCHE